MQCADFQESEVDGYSELRHYLISRLLWDPSLDTDRLIDEFVQCHYRSSAPAIRRFIDLIHEHYRQAGVHVMSNVAAYWTIPVDPEIGRQGVALMKEAAALAADEIIKERVDRFSISAYRAAIDPVWNESGSQETRSGKVTSLRHEIEAFLILSERYDIGPRAKRDELKHLLD